MRILRFASIGALLVLVACGGEEGKVARRDRPLPVVSQEAPPAFTVTLSAAGSTILEPDDIVETDSGLYLFGTRADELWFVPFGGPDRTPRSIGSLRKYGQNYVFAIGSHPDGIGVAGVDGRLRLMSYDDPTELEYSRVVAQPMNRPLGLTGTRDGGWIIAHARMLTWANRSAVGDSTIAIRVSADGEVERLWSFERTGPNRPDTFIADRMAAGGIPDTLIIVGTLPARVILVSLGGVTIDTLLDVPARALNGEDRSALNEVRAMKEFPHLRNAVLPEAHFAILRARPIGRAIFAVARTAERRLVLDLYCDRIFERTVLGDTNTFNIFPGARGVTVLHESGDQGDVRLEFHPWNTFNGACES